MVLAVVQVVTEQQRRHALGRRGLLEQMDAAPDEVLPRAAAAAARAAVDVQLHCGLLRAAGGAAP
eukprot:2847086-Prymnesium_polylepis.1